MDFGVIEGLFGKATIEGDFGTRSISDLILPMEGKSMEVHLHHYPIYGKVDQPGGGSCNWGVHCPHGHRNQPGWLFNQKLVGVVQKNGLGEWSVGTDLLRFDLMEGHFGRLVYVSLLDGFCGSMDEKPVSDLLREAEGMLSFLHQLKGSLKP